MEGGLGGAVMEGGVRGGEGGLGGAVMEGGVRGEKGESGLFWEGGLIRVLSLCGHGWH